MDYGIIIRLWKHNSILKKQFNFEKKIDFEIIFSFWENSNMGKNEPMEKQFAYGKTILKTSFYFENKFQFWKQISILKTNFNFKNEFQF